MSSSFSRRGFLRSSTLAAASLTASHSLVRASPKIAMANDEIRLGFIGCGGRAGEHLQTFSKLDGVKIAALCDPDEGKVFQAKEKFDRQAKVFADLRQLIDDKDVDAVVIAACNHWHCLAAIWAMQAGKDVYVEKPLSHTQWEGRQTVLAAGRYGRVCQVGTQQRSDPMQKEIKSFLHQEKGLGSIQSVRVNRYGVRQSIGIRKAPLPHDPKINYDLWLGPAEDKPIYREKFHYDWHWDWNTGSGEMGNWGVHVLDDVRNNVFLDNVRLPKKVLGGGARIVWNDAGETPNVHFVYFDTGTIPVVIGLSNLPESPSSDKSPKVPGPGSGYVVYCDGGRLEGQRGYAVAFDTSGKQIRRFQGNSGNRVHQENFLAAVRAKDPTLLNTEVSVGHDSTGWCNVANIAFQCGTPYQSIRDSLGLPLWRSLVEEMKSHFNAYQLNFEKSNVLFSDLLQIDPEKECFIGENADRANAFLKRKYRAPYVVPDMSV